MHILPKCTKNLHKQTHAALAKAAQFTCLSVLFSYEEVITCNMIALVHDHISEYLLQSPM